MTDSQQELKRGLKNRHVQLLAIGGAIGTGLFLGSGRTLSSSLMKVFVRRRITAVASKVVLPTVCPLSCK